MTPHGKDPSDADDPDNGILEEAPSVDTTGISLLGTQTAHVNIALPADDEDDDEDIVEGDVAFAGGFVTIELPPVEQELADDDIVGVEEVEAAEEVAGEAVGESSAIDVPSTDDEAAPEDSAAPEDDSEADAPIEDDDEDEDDDADDDADDVALAEPEPTGFEPVEDESDAALPDEYASLDESAPLDDAPLEKENPVNDGTSPAAEPAGRGEIARSVGAEAPVLVSRRIGELADVSERETSDLLTADRLLDPAQIARPEPEGVWQHLLYSVTGGKLNVGDGKRARARKALDRRIAAALPGGGARFVAVVSRKGGVGKTTITALLGQALADARDDRVVAVDANPDRGTLAERIVRRSGRTVRDLVRERDNLRGYNDISAIVARDETRLDVLASDTDPRIAEAFSGDEYRAVADVAAHYYSIVLTDTGTGIVHSVMGATLERADRLVVVAGRSIDEARLASETLTWLEANGYEDHVRNAIVVLNMSSPGATPVRQDELEAHFRTRVRDVLRVPYDPQLATGGTIVFRDLQPATRAAARELAAKVVEGLQSVSTAA